MYFYSICEQNKKEMRDGFPISYVMYTEPANGDLRSLLSKIVTISDQTIINILIQSILSLGTFHNIFGYIHMDAHMGNFLYQNNSENQEPDKYYHYIFDETPYYLKSCKYNIMIYDFGNSKNINKLLHSNDNITDIIVANIRAGNIIDMEILDIYSTNELKKINYSEPDFIITTNKYPETIEEDIVRFLILNELKRIPNFINQNINTLIRADYIHLVEQFYVELGKGEKDQTIINILINNLVPDIKKIKINEKNSDEKVIFENVIELCFKHFENYGIKDIFLEKKPEGDDNIINKENPYNIYEATKMVVPDIPEKVT
jgi:hypothetical protein